MSSPFSLSKAQPFTAIEHNYQKCLVIGNWSMLISLTLTLMCVAMTFFLEAHFTLSQQIAGHIGTLVFAGAFKVAYVIRCIGAHGLGREWF